MNILLTGSKGHGKDTFAGFLVQDHRYTALALADNVRWEVVNALATEKWNLAYDPSGMLQAQWRRDLFNELKGQGPTKQLLRGLLQWWGTEVRRAEDPDYWVNLTKQEIEHRNTPPYVITDASFQNEMDAFPDWLKVRIYDPRKEVPAGEHASEAGRASLRTNATIHNLGTLEELRDMARGLVQAVTAGELTPDDSYQIHFSPLSSTPTYGRVYP
jgi:hypothetical protein